MTKQLFIAYSNCVEYIRPKREANYSDRDCVQLTPSWVYIFEYAITGSGQKEPVFLEIVADFYNSQPSSEIKRTSRSLKCKWNVRKQEISKFVRIYYTVVGVDGDGASGTNEEENVE